MNTEERQLAEMLHRVTPEPPRGVTVEDVAFRLANEAGRGGRDGRHGHREPRPRRGFGGLGRGWAPVLAAASVFVVAGASAGIAVALSSHGSHHGSSSAADGYPPSTGPASTPASVTTAPQPHPMSTAPSWPPERIASGMWGAELINRDAFTPASLVAGTSSLYAISQDFLVRIDPLNGNVMNEASYSSPIPSFPNRPVISGRTVWVLTSYSGRSVGLTGYDGTTLAKVATVTVPASGPLASSPQGVLTSGSGGYLYVAAGRSVAVVNPATHQLIKRIPTSGQVSSVAVAPDGSKLYAGLATPGSLQVARYNPATGAQLGSSAVPGFGGTGGNLVATSGGVWGTVGVGMTARVWFAPGGDLSQLVNVTSGAGAGLYSVPASGGAAVWVGGSQRLLCANPSTGQVMASTPIPTDKSIVEYFGSVAVTGNGHTYALYQNQAARQSGVATLTPPAQC